MDLTLTPFTAEADVGMPNCKSPLRVDKHLLPIQKADGAANGACRCCAMAVAGQGRSSRVGGNDIVERRLSHHKVDLRYPLRDCTDSLTTALPEHAAPTAATTSWLPIPARAVASALRVLRAAWSRPPPTLPTTSSRACRFGNGYSRCPNGCATSCGPTPPSRTYLYTISRQWLPV